MRLYDRVERIHRQIEAAGFGRDAPIEARDLAPFDSYHYHGNAAVDDAIRALAIGSASRVLDVGSGLGGPARHIASTTGAAVTAVDIQADVDATARELTARTGLGHLVEHRCADILDGPPAAGAFDAVVSWLVFLHVPDRARLLSSCLAALRPGGGLYVEDFTLRGTPTAQDLDDLRVKVMCPYLPTASEYAAQVAAAGFVDVQVDDLTADWSGYTAERLALFRAAGASNRAVLGDDIYAGLEDFYATVARLYSDGVLGGVRVVARSEGAWPLPTV
jgi:SAM-dependent methyltransferase